MSDGPTESEMHRVMIQQGHAPTFVPKKERKKRDNEESRHQSALIKWWKANCHRWSLPEELLFAIPNGRGRLGPVMGAILKREGLRAGVPDLFLAARTYDRTPKGTAGHVAGAYGLFIEMKTEKGVSSSDQVTYADRLTKQGYAVVTCHSWQEARDAITNYLS